VPGAVHSLRGPRIWTPLSRAGESHYRALTALGGSGVLGDYVMLRRSPDEGTWGSWASRLSRTAPVVAPDGSKVGPSPGRVCCARPAPAGV
jgi:hypothetical protein